jgi:hypothetical protein
VLETLSCRYLDAVDNSMISRSGDLYIPNRAALDTK